MEINWYPGHMAKAKRLMKERMPLIDIVLEVIDGRIPNSSKIKDIDDIIKNKTRILIITKMDLCDLNETQKWIKYYEELGYKVIPMDLINGKNITDVITSSVESFHLKNEKRIAKGMKIRNVRAMIIGIPNVGKSTLINRLVSKKVAKIGNMPGITKSLDWIRINKDIELLDTPGILWPRLDNEEIAYNLASMTAIKETILPVDKIACHILKKLATYYPKKLKDRYTIDTIDFDDLTDTYDQIGKRFGLLIKGGEVDYDKVTSLIIKDIKDGYVKGITFDRYE
jgi:ribosome biogenesis GTPase A